MLTIAHCMQQRAVCILVRYEMISSIEAGYASTNGFEGRQLAQGEQGKVKTCPGIVQASTW